MSKRWRKVLCHQQSESHFKFLGRQFYFEAVFVKLLQMSIQLILIAKQCIFYNNEKLETQMASN